MDYDRLDALKHRAASRAADLADRVAALSRAVHADPETAFEEHRTAERCASALEAGGLRVRTGAYGLPTAFEAVAGGGPVQVVVCCELDALPGLGHACGHNVGTAAGVGTGLALAGVADEAGLTVRVLGTPAEESGGGKALLLERGAFDGADAAVVAYASGVESAVYRSFARSVLDVEFRGRAAHAAAAPHHGRNAGDALTVAQVAVGLLRQQLPDGVRVHGITTCGGEVFNAVPARTSARFGVRASHADELAEVRRRVAACAEGAATATGCTVTTASPEPDYLEFRTDPALARRYLAAARALGRRPVLSRPAASTDMGNVSHRVPALHPLLDVGSGDVFPHQAEFADHCATPRADRAAVEGATAVAWTLLDTAAAHS